MQQEMLNEELWIRENWKIFREKQQDQLKAKMAESSRFKMYRYISHTGYRYVIPISSLLLNYNNEFYTLYNCISHTHSGDT